MFLQKQLCSPVVDSRATLVCSKEKRVSDNELQHCAPSWNRVLDNRGLEWCTNKQEHDKYRVLFSLSYAQQSVYSSLKFEEFMN